MKIFLYCILLFAYFKVSCSFQSTLLRVDHMRQRTHVELYATIEKKIMPNEDEETNGAPQKRKKSLLSILKRKSIEKTRSKSSCAEPAVPIVVESTLNSQLKSNDNDNVPETVKVSHQADPLDDLLAYGDEYMAAKSIFDENADGGRTYSTGSSSSNRRNRNGNQNSSSDRNSKSHPSSTYSSMGDIENLIARRCEARFNKNYEEADRIKEELFTIHQVEVFDSLGKWKCHLDGRTGSLKGFTQKYDDKIMPAAPIRCALPEQEVQRKVELRTSMRRKRQFREADKIRDELAAAGIELMDQSNEWRSYDGSLMGFQSYDR
mmetsp:Transcript_9439/g.15541  ORF Transcript_9439/g.15541 Transcript_9439/m.15541 type:complete len:320 (+) Transcript_9439:107-1066(+)